MTGSGHSATDVTEACRRRISARADRARAAIDGGAPLPELGGPVKPGHGHQVEAHAEVGSPGRDDHGPDLRVGADGGHGPGEVGPERRAQGVALLGPVQPQGGHVPVDLDGEDLGGERIDGRSRVAGSCPERRPPAPPERRAGRPPRPAAGVGSPKRAGSMEAEARNPGLLAREAVILSTFTTETAATLPGLPWLQRRRAGRGRGVRLVGPAQREGRGVAVQPDRPARPRPVPAVGHRYPSIRTTTRAPRPRTGSTPWWTASDRVRA